MAEQGNYLVTGGAGFVGSHLVDRLLAAGHRVSVLDDLSTGRLANLAAHESNPRLQFVRGSVEDPADVAPLVRQASSGVFHLASAVGVQLVCSDPIACIRRTIHGTEAVLAACHEFKRPFLLTSSSEVYGKGVQVPFGEDDDVVMGPSSHPRWCYAYSKGVDEFLALAYHRQYGLPVVVVRLFNTVGPRQVGDYGMVVPRFVDSALAGTDIVIHGDGRQTRCFCHVLDVVAALDSLLSQPAAFGKVVNVGSDDEVTILELATQVIAACGSSSRLVHVPHEQVFGPRFDDLLRRKPALDRVKSLVGFSPAHALGRIIADVVADRRKVVPPKPRAAGTLT